MTGPYPPGPPGGAGPPGPVGPPPSGEYKPPPGGGGGLGRNAKIGLAVGAALVVIGGSVGIGLALTGGDDDESASSDDRTDESDRDDESDASDTSDSSEEPEDGDTGFEGDFDPCELASSGTPIEVGQAATATMEGPGDVVTFRFTGGSAAVDIAVNQLDDEFDPVLTICDSGGTELGRDDDGGGFPNSLLQGFELVDGDLIVVSGFLGESTGPFELSLS